MLNTANDDNVDYTRERGLVSGTMWPRWPFEVLQGALSGKFRLILLPYVLKEAGRKFREDFPSFAREFEAFIEACPYEEAANPSKRQLQEDPHISRDIEDTPIALGAIKAQADCLVSEDKDLTTIASDKLNVVLSGTFLREYMDWTSDELEAIRHRTWNDLPKRKAA
jgi:predicted nucleic acid-binding protein